MLTFFMAEPTLGHKNHRDWRKDSAPLLNLELCIQTLNAGSKRLVSGPQVGILSELKTSNLEQCGGSLETRLTVPLVVGSPTVK